jgi:NitT/TauT family transport system substrate-binding protein
MNRTRATAWLGLVWLAAGCTSPPPEPRTYKIGMVQWAAYSPLNVAEVKGFWKDLGLDVQVTAYLDNAVLNTDLQTRYIDIAEDMIGSWVDLYLQGSPLTVLGETDWSNGGDKIIRKASVNNLNSIKGQKVGVYLKLLSTNYFVGKYLAENNLKITDFVIEQAAGPQDLADKFIAGEYNLVLNYDPEATRSVNQGGGIVVKTSADYAGVIPEGFVARTDHLRGIPEEDLVNIFKGWIKGVKWVQDPANWKEWQKILNEKTYDGSSYSEAELTEFVAAVKIHDAKTQLARNQVDGGLYEYLRAANTFMLENGLSTRPFAPGDVFDNAAIVRALEESQ